MGGQTRITVSATPETAGLIEAVLEPHCHSVSRFVSDDGNWRVEGLSFEPPEASFLSGLLADILGRAPEVAIEPVENRDWVTESLASFEPVRVGRYWIYGSHRSDPVPYGCVGLELDAGAAFGSGEHPTTRGCLTALDALAHRRFRRPLDMGCGSGVLALAMAKTWPVEVLGVDIDPKAVAVARGNARRNGVAGRVRAVVGGGAYRLAAVRRSAPFDLVTANILANPLRRMARGLAGAMAPGGVCILSGLVVRDGRRVLEAHHRLGLRLVRRIEIDGWLTLVLRK